jgi:Fe2+ transport system protein FeoA
MAAGRRPIAVCPAGMLVSIAELRCDPADARRLRPLGVFEGAVVRVIGSPFGTILDVRGARLALDPALAALIVAEPLVP